MTRLVPAILLLASLLCLPIRAAQIASFDSDWKFVLSDPPAAQASSFDDSQWQSVDLPHDWSIEQPFGSRWASGTAYLPGGVGWYRKTFTYPSPLANQRVAIRFDGVYMNSHVWINGHDLGLRPNGFVSFQYDLTPYLNRDATPNTLAVRVDHSQFADSRFYTGSGIYRHVWLITTADVRIDPWGVFLTVPQNSADSAAVAIETSVTNESSMPQDVALTTTIGDDSQSDQTIAPGQSFLFHQQIQLDHPHRWSCDDPYLYQAKSTVAVDGRVVDQATTPLGIRSIQFDPETGFSLNGKKLEIKGVCLHQDAGCFGAAVPQEVFEQRLKLLKELGCNAIRTSHNPPSPEFLDLCDRLGFLVMDEAFDEWARPKRKWVAGRNNGEPSYQGYSEYFSDWSTRDIQSMVLRDRNHPSIILWSIGNEIDYDADPYFPPARSSTTRPSAAELPPIATKLIAAVKSLDTTRPVTAALANIPVSNGTGLADLLDVVGYNYQEQLYPADHAQYPLRRITGSENSHTLAAWEAVENFPYDAGQFLWTGIDYLGESPGWPMHGSPSGLLDETGVAKPLYFFRQSLWSKKPMVYLIVRPASATSRPFRGGRGIFGAPSWSARPNASVDVLCFTNCQSVELFLNGKSLGKRNPSQSHDRILSWPATFTAGVLKAIGDSDPTCTVELATPGVADHIHLTTEQTTLAADGRSIALLRASIEDAAGNPIYFADSSMKFQVSGPGHLIRLDSGDLSSREPFTSDHRRAFHGRCVAVIQGGSIAGEISIRASADGLHDGQMTIQAH